MEQTTDNQSPSPHPIGDWVISKNNQFIAFNKPSGLPVQSDKTGDKSLHLLAGIYCKSTLYLVHRIDRPASGVVIFAKTKAAATALTEQLKEKGITKTYLAVVKDKPSEDVATLRHFLKKNATKNKSEAKQEELPDAKPAELSYRVVGSSEHYHLLQLDMATGRHHQIRAQLAALGSPIKGDVKYGSRRGNKDRSIHLHAWKLAFDHPVSGERVVLEAPLPPDPVWDFFGEILAGDKAAVTDKAPAQKMKQP